jgi:hypothetical protein
MSTKTHDAKRITRARDETEEDLARPCTHCGAEPGNRCKNPSGRNAPVHAARRDHTPPVGRKPLLITDPGLTERICATLSAGAPLNVAAAAEGINQATLYRWLQLGDSEAPDDAPYVVFREAVLRARGRGIAWHVANVAQVAKGGQLKKHVIRTLRDGTKEEEKEWALPDWRASAFILERQAPGEFGRRQVLELAASDGMEPAVEAGAKGGADLGGDLGQAGLNRILTNLQAFKATREIGPGEGDVVVAELEEEGSG